MVNDKSMSPGTIEPQDHYDPSLVEGPTFRMLIVGLKDHFPARISEWFNGAILMSWGLYLILHPDLFKTPGMSVFDHMAEMTWGLPYNAESLWGLAAFVVGAIRLIALFVNGAWSRTPLLRLITAAVSAFVFTQIVIGLMHVPNTGLVVYPWLVVIDVVAAYRAGRDVAVAELSRKQRLRVHGRSSRGSAIA